MGGLMKRMPFIGVAVVAAMMAGCGLPGFANFVGEVMALFARLEKFSRRDDFRRLGRVGDWRGLYAARDSQHRAWADAGALGTRAGRARTSAQAALCAAWA